MIIGHEAVIEDLKKLAKSGELSHAYLFYGPGMVGKRTIALALAHFLEKGIFEPSAENEVLQDGMVIDAAFVKMIDPDVKDSIGIDAVREVKNFLWQKPNSSPKRTLIIDDAELLTTEAQNALLKIVEEPPASSLLIIVASDIDDLIGTIRSRLQKIYFGAVSEAAIAKWVGAENVSFAKKALGKPGLASRLLYDKEFRSKLEHAENFLKTVPALRKDFLKKLLEPEDFNLRTFLDALIMNLAWEKPSKAKAALWHKTLALRDNTNNFSLNPRLQLTNLLS
jgi:DNA polymerase III delta prime subunit